MPKLTLGIDLFINDMCTMQTRGAEVSYALDSTKGDEDEEMKALTSFEKYKKTSRTIQAYKEQSSTESILSEETIETIPFNEL